MPGETACAVCGSAHHMCGPQTSTIPVDIPPMKEAAMSGQLKEYEVEVNGNTTTMQLDEDDAARLGAGPKATPAGEAAEDDSLVTAEPKTARPANKARAGENK